MSVGAASLPDAEARLVEALRRSDPDAAAQLVDAYGDRIYTLAMRVTGAHEDADEAAQEALWTAVRGIETFTGDAVFSAWICRITARAAYQRLLRRQKAEELRLEDVLPSIDGAGGHFESLDDWSNRVDGQGQLREILTDSIDALPPDYRTALLLHDVEGMSKPDIVEVLGVGVEDVGSRVHHARLFVRKRLSEHLTSPMAG